MGSKGLKAILIRRIPGTVKPPAEARAAITGFHKLVASSERIKVLRDYGTASTVMLTQNLGGLPTRNFSEGRFDGAEALSGEALRDLILARGGVGTPTEACMAGCVIQCSNIMPDADGGLAVAPLEFETLGLCGSNLGLDSLDAIARINRLCNDLGLDTIEIGAALGVMMEAAEAPERVAAGLRPRRAAALRRRRARSRDRGRDRTRGTAGHAGGPGGRGGREGVGRAAGAGGQGPGDERVRSTRRQGHRRHLRHLAPGRRPHRRADRLRAGEPPRSRGRGGALTHGPGAARRLRCAGAVRLQPGRHRPAAGCDPGDAQQRLWPRATRRLAE